MAIAISYRQKHTFGGDSLKTIRQLFRQAKSSGFDRLITNIGFFFAGIGWAYDAFAFWNAIAAWTVAILIDVFGEDDPPGGAGATSMFDKSRKGGDLVWT
jgi:hypothetical protein